VVMHRRDWLMFMGGFGWAMGAQARQERKSVWECEKVIEPS